jgi:hypothetical protein
MQYPAIRIGIMGFLEWTLYLCVFISQDNERFYH